MASVEEFLKEPSEELLEVFSHEQLVCVAERFDLEVGDKRMKDQNYDYWTWGRNCASM